MHLLLILLIGFSGCATAESEQPRVSAVEARAYVGERVTVCDSVTSTKYDQASPGTPTFITLGKPLNQEFTIVIRREDRPTFGEPETTYREKSICVTGLVEKDGNRRQIVATDPAQFTIEDDAEEKSALSDAEIRTILIQQSIARYSGSCPCPYNRDRAGRRCGGRSAYSRPGGASPLCYDHDITDQMISAYRKKHQ